MLNKPYWDLNPLQSSLVSATSAKILCSALFISGRDPEEALQNSVLHNANFSGKASEIFSEIKIDRNTKSVELTLNEAPPRTARYYGDQGCIIIPLDADDVFFEPVRVETNLPASNTLTWPMGDIIPDEPIPPEIDSEKLREAVDTAFSDPSAFTVAFLVVYKGRIIAERYDHGVDKDTQLESWSMGKSMTSTLIGLLIQDGHFNLVDPAPVPEWHVKGDPRSQIKIVDLLRMSSGLKFSSRNDPQDTWKQGIYDHEYVYCGATDVFKFSINRPLEYPPNTVGRYRNCDPLTLGYIIKRTVTDMKEEYLSWPQRALFDRIGIRKQVLETDPYGNFILSGYDYGTARNWARLGLLYLQDGLWEGERILPEGWVTFVRTPASAWEEPVYGGLFWLNLTGRWNLPRDALYMAGAGGQWAIIVPSLDLVLVRMGFWSDVKAAETTLNAALEKLTSAIYTSNN